MSAARPRRRIVLHADIEADSWEDMRYALQNLADGIAHRGRLSTSVVSGGFSSGFAVTTDEDTSIDHESWRKANDAYVAQLREKEQGSG